MLGVAIFWQYSPALAEGEVYAPSLSHAAAVRAARCAACIRSGIARVHESNRSFRGTGAWSAERGNDHMGLRVRREVSGQHLPMGGTSNALLRNRRRLLRIRTDPFRVEPHRLQRWARSGGRG